MSHNREQEVLLRNLIKRGVVSNNIPDAGPFSRAQVKWGSDKVGNVEVLTPWGFQSVAPIGSLALMISVFGQEENRVAIINNPQKRLRGLKPGEVAVGAWNSKSYVKWLANGDIEVVCAHDQNVVIKNDYNQTVKGDSTVKVTGDGTVTITGDYTINVTGNTIINASGDFSANVTGNATITAPIVQIDGQLKVSGEITAFSTGSAITFTDIENKYNVHTHISSTPGSPTSAPNNSLP